MKRGGATAIIIVWRIQNREEAHLTAFVQPRLTGWQATHQLAPSKRQPSPSFRRKRRLIGGALSDHGRAGRRAR